MTDLSLIMVAVTFLIDIMFEKQFSPPFPMKSIPWARTFSSFNYLFMLEPYLLALTCAIPVDHIASNILIFACFLVSLVSWAGSLYVMRSYNLLNLRGNIVHASFIVCAYLVATLLVLEMDSTRNAQITTFLFIVFGIGLSFSSIVF
jgi:hypothetical protein